MPTWPASLPPLPKSGTFTFAPEPNVVEYPVDVGRGPRSQRATSVRMRYAAQMDLTRAQAEALVDFIMIDCAHGTVSFFMADWLGGATRRFSWVGDPPQPQHVAGNDWIIGLTLAREI